MDSTQTVGHSLIALSAVLLAWQWHQARSAGKAPRLYGEFIRSARVRRGVASSLVGLVGVVFVLFESVPQNPLSVSAYLFSLVLITCWILWLACLDYRATRRYREELDLQLIAKELQQVERASPDRPTGTRTVPPTARPRQRSSPVRSRSRSPGSLSS